MLTYIVHKNTLKKLTVVLCYCALQQLLFPLGHLPTSGHVGLPQPSGPLTISLQNGL